MTVGATIQVSSHQENELMCKWGKEKAKVQISKKLGLIIVAVLFMMFQKYEKKKNKKKKLGARPLSSHSHVLVLTGVMFSFFLDF